MWSHPVLEAVMRDFNITSSVLVHLGAFNLETLKPILLVGTAPYLPKLGRSMTRLERLAMSQNEAPLV